MRVRSCRDDQVAQTLVGHLQMLAKPIPPLRRKPSRSPPRQSAQRARLSAAPIRQRPAPRPQNAPPRFERRNRLSTQASRSLVGLHTPDGPRTSAATAHARCDAVGIYMPYLGGKIPERWKNDAKRMGDGRRDLHRTRRQRAAPAAPVGARARFRGFSLARYLMAAAFADLEARGGASSADGARHSLARQTPIDPSGGRP